MDPQWRDRAATAPVARIATVRADGRPRVVPCCFALAGDLLYWAVDHKPKTTHQLGRLDDIAAHPSVSLVVDHYADDWSELWWVRLDGEARVIDDAEEREGALDLLAAKYQQYREHRPSGAVVAVNITRWQTWGAASQVL
jgi:PPOX class probable F420-dependent enzyme